MALDGLKFLQATNPNVYSGNGINRGYTGTPSASGGTEGSVSGRGSAWEGFTVPKNNGTGELSPQIGGGSDVGSILDVNTSSYNASANHDKKPVSNNDKYQNAASTDTFSDENIAKMAYLLELQNQQAA